MRRRELMFKQGRLPAEYQEVEWVGNPNQDCGIDTDIYYTLGLEASYEVEACVTENIVSTIGAVHNDFVCGWNSGGGINIVGSSDKTRVYWWSGTNPTTGLGDAFKKTNIKVVINAAKTYSYYYGYEDGELAWSTDRRASGLAYQGKPFPLFGRSDTLGQFKIFHFLYKEGGETISELIPCYRVSDGEIGFYDLVKKAFFNKSRGTGTLTKGADV